jgi:hypothetical protein
MRGANYVELINEDTEPSPYGTRTHASAGGIAWMCPDPPPDKD